MEQKHVRSLEGSPRPSNLFQPFMPEVELYSDMDAFFAKTDELAAGGIVPDPVNDEQSGTQPGQRSWDTCISCGSKEDPYFDTITAYHHPPDAYFGLLVGVLISVAAGTLSNFLPGTPNQHYFLYVLFSISLAAGFEYYSFRSTSAKYHLVACPSCRKKYTNRKLLRVAIITTLVLISVVGAVVVSAVAGSDEYVYLPVISAGIIGVIALYFKLLSKPKLVEAGADESIINVPGLGHVQVDNSLSEVRS